MMTYYYVENREVKHITLNAWEYGEESKKHRLFTDKKEAKRERRKK